MKKSLLAFAALATVAGAASAQSSVTLFGIVDAGVARLSAKTTTGSKTVTGMTTGSLNTSRLGFRGVEDMGGGLRAGFHIEAGLTVDDGNAAGFNFTRRSTASLLGGFGEVRLGRDYVPSFWNTVVYDPFGIVGIGGTLTNNTIVSAPGGGNGTNAVRASNSVGYFLPGNLGGFNGQFMYAFGENTGGVKTNNYLGFRLGYAAGPLSVHGSYGKTEGATNAADVKYLNFGASFDLGVVKPMVIFAQEKNGANGKVTAYQGGVTVPLGQGELRAAYSRYNVDRSSNDWNKLAIGYGYNLSKRTQMYAAFARVDNDGAQTRLVTATGLGFAGLTVLGGKTATGLEAGLRHSF